MNNNESVKKICPHCGHEIPGDSVFCVKCGLSVEEVGSVKTNTSEADNTAQLQTEIKRVRRGLNIAIIGLAVLLVWSGVLTYFLVAQNIDNIKDTFNEWFASEEYEAESKPDGSCSAKGCLNTAYGQKYCKEHRCITVGCGNQRVGLNFCYYHKCAVDGCEIGRMDNLTFCYHHRNYK